MMNRSTAVLLAGAVLLLGMTGAGARQGAAPAFPVAEWTDKPLDLEDLRGQMVAIVFYDDDTVGVGTPAWVNAAAEIKHFAQQQNFVLIPVALFDRPSDFKELTKKIWGTDINCARDLGHTTYEYLRRPITEDCCIMVIDTMGRFVHRGGKLRASSSYYDTEGSPCVPVFDLKRAMGGHVGRGLLGGLAPPPGTEAIIKAIKSARYGEAESKLKKLSDEGAPGRFKKALKERLEALQKEKAALVARLKESGDTWGAYKVGQSFVRCFPKSSEAGVVRGILASLKSDATVKKNLAAKKAVEKVLSKGKRAKKKKKKKGGGGGVAEVINNLILVGAKHPKTEWGKIASTASK
ncbi:MAG: hypothetical protein ACYTAF_02760 [Planctomycetota bacterium]|jgi:hypothetical protein